MHRNAKTGLPRYCSYNTDRHGVRRVHFRKRGFRTYLGGIPWPEPFMTAYAKALDGLKSVAGVGVASTAPGSFNALAVAYYRSPEFLSLRPTSRSTRRGIIERFRREHGPKPIARLERSHIMGFVGAKSAHPSAANNLLKVLKLLLNYAISYEMLTVSPALGVKGYKIAGDGHHTWTEDEIFRFEARHPKGTPARLALALLLYTAQRRGDVLRMGPADIKAGVLAVTQEKTETPLLIPIHAELAEVLAMVPKEQAIFIVNKWGKPFHPNSFTNWFKRRCSEAGLVECSAHGLRKASATRLANAGCSANEIASITGHGSLVEVARYTKKADQARLARSAMGQMGYPLIPKEIDSPEIR
jgi:integrase